MAPKDGTGAERNARYERIGKASAKAIKNMLAGTVLGDKLRAKGYTWLTEKKAPQEADRGSQLPSGDVPVADVRAGSKAANH
jgi:hypothetical protein